MASAEPSLPPAGDTAYLYRAALGERAQDYYLRQFARFDGAGRAGTSWNWAAYWSTLNWLIYRRMWGWALAYVAALAGLALLIFGVGKLLLDYSAASAWLLFLGLLTLAFVVPGLYGNAWLYHHLNERISAALRETQDVKAAATALAAQAPSQRRLLLIALANATLLALAALLVQLFDGAEPAPPQLAEATRALATAQAPVPPPTQAASAPEAALAAASPPALAASAQPVAVAASAPAGRAEADAAAPARALAASAAEPSIQEAAAAGAVTAVPRPARAGGAQPGAAAVSAQPTVAARAAGGPDPSAPVPARVAEPQALTPQTKAAAAAAPAAQAAQSAPAPARPRLARVWVIQVGAYAEAANAERALAQVQGLGLEAGAESFEAPGQGRLIRVRVGPFTRQAEAEQAVRRIQALGLPVLLIRQRP